MKACGPCAKSVAPSCAQKGAVRGSADPARCCLRPVAGRPAVSGRTVWSQPSLIIGRQLSPEPPVTACRPHARLWRVGVAAGLPSCRRPPAVAVGRGWAGEAPTGPRMERFSRITQKPPWITRLMSCGDRSGDRSPVCCGHWCGVMQSPEV